MRAYKDKVGVARHTATCLINMSGGFDDPKSVLQNRLGSEPDDDKEESVVLLSSMTPVAKSTFKKGSSLPLQEMNILTPSNLAMKRLVVNESSETLNFSNVSMKVKAKET